MGATGDRGTVATGAHGAVRTFRARQIRRIAVFVTLPGLVLGTGSIAAAFGVGLFDHTKATPCAPTVVRAPARNSFKITVMNAAETSGEATVIGQELTKRGFAIKAVSNAPEGVYIKRAAIIYHGPTGRDQALLVGAQVPGSLVYNDGRAGTSVDLVIGYGFKGLVTVPPAPPPLPREIKVNVYNTTWRAGLAGQAAADLRARQFRTGEVGNDPIRSFLPDDVAVLRFGADGADAATVLRTHLPGARMQRDDRLTKVVDLVLGNGYENLLPIAQVPKPAPRPVQPPETVARPCSGG